MMISLQDFESRHRDRENRLTQLQILEKRQGPQPRSRKEAIAWFQKCFEHCPFPAWIKDEHFVTLAVNPAYSELYEVKTTGGQAYVGRADDVWPEPTAEAFHAFDRAAMREGYVVTHEHIRNVKQSREESLLGVKWAIELDGGEVLVAGLVSGNMPKPVAARMNERRTTDDYSRTEQ